MEEFKKVRDTEEVGAACGICPKRSSDALQLRRRPLFFIAHSFSGIILAHVGRPQEHTYA